MTRISIIGATFYGNRGAEAMLSTTIAQARKGGVDTENIHVFSYYPESDRSLIGDSRLHIHSATPAHLVLVLLPLAILYRLTGFPGLGFLQTKLPNSIVALARSRVLICLAGVSFVDGRTKFIPYNIATILPALLLGTPVVKFSQAMGGFGTLVNRVAARFFLSRCLQVFTRGSETQRHVQALLGDSNNYQRADDVAFHFDPEDCISKPAPEISKHLEDIKALKLSGKTVVGICPSVVVERSSSEAGLDYSDYLARTISRLTASGFGVVLYPNATRGEHMDKLHNNDLPLIQSLANRLDNRISSSLVILDGSLNAAQIHDIIGACDVHAVSRFHAMVCALAQTLPVLVIGWSHKYLEVMERFDQGDMVLDYTDGDVEPLISLIKDLVDNRDFRSDQIRNALPAVKASSVRQFEYVAALVAGDA